MSFEEWVALPEDAPGELVDGFLVEEEVPEYVHELVVAWLIHVLRDWGSARGAFVAASGAKFRVTPRRGRMPDVTVYLAGDNKPPKRGLITAPPSIAVEVISSNARDERATASTSSPSTPSSACAGTGSSIPSCARSRFFERTADSRYLRVAESSNAAIEHVPGCEGLRIRLSDLWAEIDRLDD